MGTLPTLHGAPSKITVLLSGGIDSAAVAAYYLQLKFEIQALFVDYGQAAAKKERKAAHCLSKFLGIPVSEVFANHDNSFSKGEIPGRNAFLIFSALLTIQRKPHIIALGVHAGVPYYDCSQSFLDCTQQIIDGYTNGRIKIAAPFLKWNKPMIWRFFKDQGLPVDMTYSCETGYSPPCGSCASCIDREELYAL